MDPDLMKLMTVLKKMQVTTIGVEGRIAKDDAELEAAIAGIDAKFTRLAELETRMDNVERTANVTRG